MRSIKQLVFEGGGVKGIAYAGALAVLEEQRCLHEVKHVAGSSAGAIIALLVSLSYPANELNQLLDIDFKALEDGSSLKTMKGASFLQNWGIHPGKRLHAMLSAWIEQKLGNAKATFEDLHRKVLSEGSLVLQQAHYRDLHLYTTDLNTHRPVLLSYYTTPKLSLVEAVRASAALPGFFYPSKSIINGETHYWVDGGLIRNYPIKLFDSAYPNTETLGFRLDTADEISQFVHQNRAPTMPTNTLGEYFMSILEAAMYAQDAHQVQENYRTVYIDTLDVKTTDFNLSPEKKAALIQSGRDATMRFLAQSRHTPALRDLPLALQNQSRLGKYDRYRLYERAAAVFIKGPVSVDNDTSAQIQWLLLISADQDDWCWQQKMNRYIERLKQQPEIFQLMQARLIKGFEYQGERCQGWVVNATVMPELILEGERWLAKYGQHKARLATPILPEQYVIQQQLQHQRYPKWIMVPPADIAARRRLFQAVDNGDRQTVINYLAAGGAGAIQDDSKRQDYLLHKAVFRLDECLVGLLLNCSDVAMAIDKDNAFGDTPLHTALFHRSLGEEEAVQIIVQMLIQHHAHPDIQNKDGQTPLMFAVENTMEQVIRVLLLARASVVIRDRDGRQAIDYLPHGKQLDPAIEQRLRQDVDAPLPAVPYRRP